MRGSFITSSSARHDGCQLRPENALTDPEKLNSFSQLSWGLLCEDVSQPTLFVGSRPKTVKHLNLMFYNGVDESEDDRLLKLVECRSLPVADGAERTWDASPLVSLAPAVPTGDF